MKHFLIALIACALIAAALSFFIPKGFFGNRAAVTPTVDASNGDSYRESVKPILTKLSADIQALTKKNHAAHSKVLEMRDIAKAAIAELRKLSPPSDVSDVHYAIISALQYCVDAVNDRVDFIDDAESVSVMMRCAEKLNSVGD